VDARPSNVVGPATSLRGVHGRILVGDSVNALVDEAENGYDLLVVDNLVAGASRFLLGSVPNKVSHHSSCALLIVHTT
jgi:nucleotide-binding universal stress UspA family protein